MKRLVTQSEQSETSFEVLKELPQENHSNSSRLKY